MATPRRSSESDALVSSHQKLRAGNVLTGAPTLGY